MKYRYFDENNISIEIENDSLDLALNGVLDTKTGIQVYKNDIIRIDGYFEDTIWYNATRRSSGKPSKTKLKGYAIYQVTDGGDASFENMKLLKAEQDLFSKKGNVYFARNVYPSYHNWRDKESIKIIGNIYNNNIEVLLKSNKIIL